MERASERRRFLAYVPGAAAGILTGALVLGAVACVTPPRGIPVVEGIEQDDIPVPGHFEFEHSESPDLGTLEEGKFRSWTGFYRGSGKYNDLIPWYIAQMQKKGWTFTRREGLSERERLYFEKEDEYAKISLYREMNARAGTYTNVVRAEIHPLGIEDHDIETNLARLRSAGTDEAEILPASYSPQEDAEEQGPSARHTGGGHTLRGNRMPDAKRARIVEQIEADEAE